LEAILRHNLPIYPGVGLAGIFASTVLALVLIPDDARPAGALFSAAAVMSLGLLAAPALSCIHNPRALLRVENLVMCGLVYWLLLDLVQGSYDLNAASYKGIQGAFASIGLFAGTFWVACLFPPHGIPRFIRESTCLSLNANILVGLAVVFFTLAMLNYAIACDFDWFLMFSAVLRSRWESPWARGALGGWDAFRDHLQFFGYVLPTLTVLVALQKGWSHLNTILCCLMSVTILLFLSQSGGRRIIGVTAGAAIVCLIVAGGELSLRRTLAALCAVGGLLVFMHLMLEYRGVGFSRAFEDNARRITGKRFLVEDDFLRLAQTLDLVPERHPYVYEQRLVYTLVRPIPRVFWPDKPVTPGFDLAAALGERGVTLSFSVIADWYIMAGWPMVLVGGFLYGRLAGTWSQLLGLQHNLVAALIYSLGAMAVFASLRSIDELLLQSYTVMAWLAVSRLFLNRRHASYRED
jgi:hypothetical protein